MLVFQTASARNKISEIETACADALLLTDAILAPRPLRDLEIRSFKDLPDKIGLSTVEGRARMLHDLASIELQAMELGLRTLIEFPEAPRHFREQLAEVTISEGRHLNLCLNAIEELGFYWGKWPVHMSLWDAVDAGEGLLDRILIVHRYLEGSGLDASARLMRRLLGMPIRDIALTTVETIFKEEIDHVDFGSRWYKAICLKAGLDPADDFSVRMNKLHHKIPYRSEPLAIEARIKAGFTAEEINTLEKLRQIKPQRSLNRDPNSVEEINRH
jgi:uncharacterized ferritin-like protein (DUF455 family)